MTLGKPRVKICCMGSVEEARLAIACGASALGLVSAMPSGPGVISEERIAEIAAAIPPGVGSFLLTSATDAVTILGQQRRTRVNTLQLVDRIDKGTHERLHEALPGIALVQVIHVRGEESVNEAVKLALLVDAILLDSGNQALPIKELGGTGRVHDWRLSKRIVESVACPVFLAGGLRAENVESAIREVRPYGVDVCSGVRTDGMLDQQKLRKFFAAVERASG
jgi:phosphoribosylanthranilate isomerase